MCYVTDVSYNGTRHQVNVTSGPEALIALGLDVNTNILYYFPWINNKAELICFQQRLSKKYLRFSLKLTENKITFRRKQHSFCKGRKSKVWFEFLFMFFSLGHLFSLPWKGFPEKKKKIFSIFWFQGLTAFCHFIFFSQTNEIEKSVSGVRCAASRLAVQALCLLWYLKNVCTVFRFSLVV